MIIVPQSQAAFFAVTNRLLVVNCDLVNTLSTCSPSATRLHIAGRRFDKEHPKHRRHGNLPSLQLHPFTTPFCIHDLADSGNSPLHSSCMAVGTTVYGEDRTISYPTAYLFVINVLLLSIRMLVNCPKFSCNVPLRYSSCASLSSPPTQEEWFLIRLPSDQHLVRPR